IEERRPDHCLQGRQDPRRNNGCDRVGGIVESVDEVEGESDENHSHHNEYLEIHQPCFTTTFSRRLATSSQRSVASSSRSKISFHFRMITGSRSSSKSWPTARWWTRSASFSSRLISTPRSMTPLRFSSASSARRTSSHD